MAGTVEIIHTLVAPVVMISAQGLICLALYNRLAAVSKQKPGLIAQQEVDDAQSKDMVAEAQVSAANSALAAAQQQVDVDQSSTERVQTLIDYERVTAPFTGVITKRYADKGSMIQAGTASQTQAMGHRS